MNGFLEMKEDGLVEEQVTNLSEPTPAELLDDHGENDISVIEISDSDRKVHEDIFSRLPLSTAQKTKLLIELMGEKDHKVGDSFNDEDLPLEPPVLTRSYAKRVKTN